MAWLRRVPSAGAGALMFAVALVAAVVVLASRGFPANVVVADVLFGGTIVALLGFAVRLALEDKRRDH